MRMPSIRVQQAMNSYGMVSDDLRIVNRINTMMRSFR